MAVGAHELARHDHDRPDHQIDDGLLRIADGILRKEITRRDLPEGQRQGGDAERAGEDLLGAVPNFQHQRQPSNPQPAVGISAESAEIISGEIFESFATWSWCAIISSRLVASASGDGTTMSTPCA